MYTLEETNSWYMIYLNGKYYCQVNKEHNSLAAVKEYFNIKEEEEK